METAAIGTFLITILQYMTAEKGNNVIETHLVWEHKLSLKLPPNNSPKHPNNNPQHPSNHILHLQN